MTSAHKMLDKDGLVALTVRHQFSDKSTLIAFGGGGGGVASSGSSKVVWTVPVLAFDACLLHHVLGLAHGVCVNHL